MNKIYKSGVYSGLYELTNNTISVAITSPPYWAQRDYGFNGQIGNEKTFMIILKRLLIFSIS